MIRRRVHPSRRRGTRPCEKAEEEAEEQEEEEVRRAVEEDVGVLANAHDGPHHRRRPKRKRRRCPRGVAARAGPATLALLLLTRLILGAAAAAAAAAAFGRYVSSSARRNRQSMTAATSSRRRRPGSRRILRSSLRHDEGGEGERRREIDATCLEPRSDNGGGSILFVAMDDGDVASALQERWGTRPLLIRGAVNTSRLVERGILPGSRELVRLVVHDVGVDGGHRDDGVSKSNDDGDNKQQDDGDVDTDVDATRRLPRPGREEIGVDATAAAGESARLVVRQFVGGGDGGAGRRGRRHLGSMSLEWGPFSPSDLQWAVGADNKSPTKSHELVEEVDAADDDEESMQERKSGPHKIYEEDRGGPRFGRAFPKRRRQTSIRRGGTGRRSSSSHNAINNSLETRTLLLNDVDRYVPALADWLDFEFTDALLRQQQPHQQPQQQQGQDAGAVAAPPMPSTPPPLLPRWRRDDAQLSLSSLRGGIGPHVDSYDVFLIQVSGAKRWTLSEGPMSVHEEWDRIVPNLDVRVLDLDRRGRVRRQGVGADSGAADDEDSIEENDPVLLREPIDVHPGDVLYIPPRYVHDGVALTNNCQTLSVGCRAPSASELLQRVADRLVLTAGASGDLPFGVVEAGAARYMDETLPIHTGDHDNEGGGHDSATISSSTKNRMKDMVRRAVDAVMEDDCLWDELVGRLATESLRGSDLASLVMDDADDGQGIEFDSDDAKMWQRRPGVTLATTQPTQTRVRLYCGGEMWEAEMPSAADSQSLLSLLLRVERGERVASRSVDESACATSAELWTRLVEDGVVVPVG